MRNERVLRRTGRVQEVFEWNNVRRRVVRKRNMDLHARVQRQRDVLDQFADDAELRQLHLRRGRQKVQPRLHKRRAVHHGLRVRERRLQEEARTSVFKRHRMRDRRLRGWRLLQHGLLGLMPRVQQSGLRRDMHVPRGNERP